MCYKITLDNAKICCILVDIMTSTHVNKSKVSRFKRKSKKEELTQKQQLFIKYYNGSPKEAALKAGYSKRAAKSIGYENMTKQAIVQAIKEKNEIKHNKIKQKLISNDELRVWWQNIMDSPDYDISTRIKCSELLGKSKAIFIDNVKHTGNMVQFVIERPQIDSKPPMKKIEGKEVQYLIEDKSNHET